MLSITRDLLNIAATLGTSPVTRGLLFQQAGQAAEAWAGELSSDAPELGPHDPLSSHSGYQACKGWECVREQSQAAHLKILVLFLRECPLRDHQGAQAFTGHVPTLEKNAQVTRGPAQPDRPSLVSLSCRCLSIPRK